MKLHQPLIRASTSYESVLERRVSNSGQGSAPRQPAGIASRSRSMGSEASWRGSVAVKQDNVLKAAEICVCRSLKCNSCARNMGP